MTAEHPLARAVDHQLHEDQRIAPRHRRPHRPERGLVDVDLRKRCARRFLRQPDRADLRRPEHRRRNIRVIDRRRRIVEHGLGKRRPLADRNRRQIHAVRHVADRIDVRHRRARIGVDLHRTRVRQLHAATLKPKPPGVRPPPDREHHLVDDVLRTIFEPHPLAPILGADATPQPTSDARRCRASAARGACARAPRDRTRAEFHRRDARAASCCPAP